MNKRLITASVVSSLRPVAAQRTEVLLERAGSSSGEIYPEAHPGYDDEQWQAVTVPLDWAIADRSTVTTICRKCSVTQISENRPPR